MNPPELLTAEISAGELLDKIAILEIKQRRISDSGKQQNIRRELEALSSVRARALPSTQSLDAYFAELTRVNEILWDTEDEIRDCERRRDFGARFVELARTVYRTNDQRSAIKRAVNDLVGSRLVEEKSYSHYDAP